VWLYDVSDPDKPARVGAVSATTSTTQDGTVLRLFMKDQFLYTSTFLKGLEVIDLQQVVAEYKSVFSSDPTQFAVPNCATQQWERMWSSAFRLYNSGCEHYSAPINDIVSYGMQHEPY
jgi:hypothetical protein